MSAIAELIVRSGYSGIFAVPGVPITNSLIELSTRKCVVACRSEQTAANAAAAFGYQAGTYGLQSARPLLESVLTDVDWELYERLQTIGGPGLCITTSGPAFVNALSGVATAAANCWPMVVLSSTVGNKHDPWFDKFQRYPQAKIAEAFECIKKVYYVQNLQKLAQALGQAREESMRGVPGPVLIECEWDVWASKSGALERLSAERSHTIGVPRAHLTNSDTLGEAFQASSRPLFIFGKGLAFSGGILVSALLSKRRELLVPMLMSPMGKGILEEDDQRNCGAARSHVMNESDAVFVFGARINWMFDCDSGWLDNKKSILLFNHGQAVGGRLKERYGIKITNDKADGLTALLHVLANFSSVSDTKREWFEDVNHRCQTAKAMASRARVRENLTCTRRQKGGRTFAETFEAIHKMFPRKPDNSIPWWLFGANPTSYIIEGATSLDKSRIHLPIDHPKQRMDTGTLGAMGLGAPFALGVAMWKYLAMKAICSSDGIGDLEAARVVLIQGDHAFGFSSLDIETIGRYRLPIKMIVLDNGGMYALDPSESREAVQLGEDEASKRFSALSVTDLTANSRFDKIAEAFHFPCALRVSGDGEADLLGALLQAKSTKGPALVTVAIDPLDGSKAGFIAKML